MKTKPLPCKTVGRICYSARRAASTDLERSRYLCWVKFHWNLLFVVQMTEVLRGLAAADGR